MSKAINLVALFLFASFAVIGFSVGGFSGGVLTGIGSSMTIVSIVVLAIQNIVARRLRNASAQIAEMLGPQGQALLSKFAGK